jgi:hypothetical protein
VGSRSGRFELAAFKSVCEGSLDPSLVDKEGFRVYSGDGDDVGEIDGGCEANDSRCRVCVSLCAFARMWFWLQVMC